MKSRLWGAVCAFGLIVLTNPAHAALVKSILGLDIGGTLYDVTFHDGAGDSFNALWDADNDGVFGGGSSIFSTAPTFWDDEAGAFAATDAIITVLGGTDTTTLNGDSFLIPYRVRSNLDITPLTDAIINAYDTDLPPSFDTPGNAVTDDSQINLVNYFPYASFTPSAVPIPAAVWLFGSGLLGLIGMARLKAA